MAKIYKDQLSYTLNNELYCKKQCKVFEQLPPLKLNRIVYWFLHCSSCSDEINIFFRSFVRLIQQIYLQVKCSFSHRLFACEEKVSSQLWVFFLLVICLLWNKKITVWNITSCTDLLSPWFSSSSIRRKEFNRKAKC